MLPGPSTLAITRPDIKRRPERVDSTARKSAWARLLARVYEVDPFVCPECGSPIKVIAVIQDPDEIKHIVRHLIKIGRAPPGLDESSVN
jgi:hypothetical protein